VLSAQPQISEQHVVENDANVPTNLVALTFSI
jgi:hypothetical protein